MVIFKTKKYYVKEEKLMKNNNIEGMLGSMDLSNVEKKTVALNQSKRLPAIILVDTSGSMSSYENP